MELNEARKLVELHLIEMNILVFSPGLDIEKWRRAQREVADCERWLGRQLAGAGTVVGEGHA